MEVKVNYKKDTSQAEIDVTVPVQEFAPFLEKAARKLSKDTPLKGFRPGKAPLNVVVDAFGQDRVVREAMDLSLPFFFVEAAVSEEVEAINRPAITVHEIGLDTPFRFTAVVDVLPEVKLGDASTIKADKREAKVEDEQIDKELKYLARMRSQLLDIARPAEEGDVVTVDFQVRINGQPIEGGESKNHPITIGEGRFIPDFEKGLKGIQAEEERTFPMTFPEDYAQEELRGKKAEVTIKAHRVQKQVVPELNDEFAKGLGKFESMNDLRNKLKENLQAEAEAKERERHLGELAAKLAEKTEIGPIPSVLIEKEIDQRIEEFARMLAYQGKTLDDYLASQEKTPEQMREDMRESAEKHVKMGLTMRKFAEEQKIEVTEEEIQQEAAKHLQHYGDPKQAEKDIDPQALREHVTSEIRNRKTMEKLEEMVGKKA